jgi:hypothetical protein
MIVGRQREAGVFLGATNDLARDCVNETIPDDDQSAVRTPSWAMHECTPERNTLLAVSHHIEDGEVVTVVDGEAVAFGGPHGSAATEAAEGHGMVRAGCENVVEGTVGAVGTFTVECFRKNPETVGRPAGGSDITAVAWQLQTTAVYGLPRQSLVIMSPRRDTLPLSRIFSRVWPCTRSRLYRPAIKPAIVLDMELPPTALDVKLNVTCCPLSSHCGAVARKRLLSRTRCGCPPPWTT